MQIARNIARRFRCYGSEFCFGLACEIGAGNVSAHDMVDFVNAVAHHVVSFFC